MTEKNPLLGHWICERGGRAEVRQTKKKGRHFYTHCNCCGLNQGTGEQRQQAIFDNAEFLQGVTIARPSGVVEKPGEGVTVDDQPKIEHKPKAEPDFDPTIKTDEPGPVDEPAAKSGLVRFLPGVILLVAAGVGAWMS